MKKKIISIFVCMLLFATVSSVAVTVNFEKNVKVVKMNATPVSESLEVTGVMEPISIENYGIMQADIQVTSADEDEYAPAIGVDPYGEYLMAYTYKESVSSHDVPWSFSTDGGQTWVHGATYDITGVEGHPAISYRGSEKKFTGTLEGDWEEGDGAIQYYFMCDDPTDSNTYLLNFIDWSSSYPYSDRLIPDCGGYVLADKPWWYGMQACVGTRGDPGSVDMPIFNYGDYEAEGSGWSSYFGEYGGCENAALDVDLTNGYFYAVFDYLDGSDWDLLLMRGDCNGDGGTPDEHPLWFADAIIGDTENTTHPAVGANEDYVMIVAQTNEAGNEDIVCYYSDDAGGTFQMSYVADSGADELYPSIVVYGLDATCTFIMNDDLYYSKTTDGGATWDTPTQVNDVNGMVESEFRNVDITTDGTVIWTDNRDGNLDLYLDNVGGVAQPVLEIGSITGGLFKIKAEIKNVGTADATSVAWTIDLTGGLILLGKTSSDTISSIPASGQVTATSKLIFGIGKPVVTVTAEIPEMSATKDVDARVLLFFIIIS